MKRFILSLILFFTLLIPVFSYAQFAPNIQSIGGSYGDYVVKVIHDKDDNRYILGSIGLPGTVSFPGYQTEQINFGSIKKELYKSFIAKYNKDNQCVWVRPGPSFIKDTYSDIAVDDAGFVYVTGQLYFKHFILEKIDKFGNLVWEKKYKSKSSADLLPNDFVGESIAVDKQGNIYVAGQFDGANIENFTFDFVSTRQAPYTDYLAKFNPNGEVLWVKSTLQSNLFYNQILVDSKGNIITEGRFRNEINISGLTLKNENPPDSYGAVDGRFFIKRDPEGNVIWAKSIPLRTNGSHSVVLDTDDNIYFIAPKFGGDSESVAIDGIQVNKSLSAILVKLDSSGTAKWAINFQGSSSSLSMIAANQSIYLAGSFYKEFKFKDEVLKGNKSDFSQTDIFLLNLNLNGEKLWLKRYGGPFFESSPKITFLPKKKEIILAGTFSEQLPNNDKLLISKGEGDIFIGQIPDTLTYYDERLARISGRLYEDKDSNCLYDSTENKLANKLLIIEPGSMLTMADEQGNYSIEVPYGTFTVKPLISPASEYQIVQSCLENALVQTDSLHKQITNLNFGYTIKECSVLTVDIATDHLRRCFRSKTTVTYTNDGAADAQNVKIQVTYPQYVVPISSTLPWAAQQESTLLFNVGTLKAGERRSFIISDSTVCGNESIRGLSQCIRASISPRNSCVAPNPAWDESSVTVAANFAEEEQTAEFTIANEGNGDMTDSTTYRLYANTALIKSGKVKLIQGAQAKLAVPAAATTLRLEADQSLNHPGESRPTVSLQMAPPPDSPPAMAAPTPVDAFYQDDADAEVEISCQTIVDSYDPNDKQVSPAGITKRHYIKAEDDLEYLIRFQNTGTDVAYKVVIQDTLNSHLDISTLRVGPASHPFTYSVSGKGQPVLTFTFKDINLPDHKANEPGSHGYIKFNISQKPNNPKGTVIKNIAYNYFDYNSPIATNQVFNIIGDTLILPPAPVMVYDCGQEMPTPALAGIAINLCEVNKTILKANKPQKGSGRWHLLSGQATIVEPNNPESELTQIGYGQVELEWIITLCRKISRSKIIVNRYAIPPAPAIPTPPIQCEENKLLPLTAIGTNITWYADAAKTRILHLGNIFTPTIHATTTFYATQNQYNCESPSTAVMLLIQPAQIDFLTSGDTLIAPVAESYQWYFNDTKINGATDAKFLARNTGNYKVKAITNGCATTSNNKVHIISLAAATLTLSPNPTPEQLFFEFASDATGTSTIVIWNDLGQRVYTQVQHKTTTLLGDMIEVKNLQAGLYLLEVQCGKAHLVRKFIKL